MLGKSPDQKNAQSDLFRPLLASFIDLNHPLVKLGEKMDWATMEQQMEGYYANFGAPSKPVRLMAGLLILKGMFNQSDEVVVESWKQNPYYQYFTGRTHFAWDLPCDPSDLVHFRKRIGEAGVKTILDSSQQLHVKKIEAAQEVIVDTTVQEKNITFPTDTKLALKIIVNSIKFASRVSLKLKQTFGKELKSLKLAMRFSHHPRRRKQARKAMKRIRTIAGILLREIDRKLSDTARSAFSATKQLYESVLAQKRHTKHKVYSLHEPQVACIAKGKSHKPYEFGAKISIAMLPGTNVVVGVSHFKGNPHDSQTLPTALKELTSLVTENLTYAIVDRGYRGNKHVEGLEVVIPNTKKDQTQSVEYQKNKSRQCRSRAAVEPIISHIKYDCRMIRNFLKGEIGDKINAMLAGAAFNFRLALNEIKNRVLFAIISIYKLHLLTNTLYRMRLNK